MERPAPVNYHKKDAHLFYDNEIQDYYIPEMNIFKLDNCRLFDDGSIYQNGKLIRESVRDEEMLKSYSRWTLFKRNLLFKRIASETDKVYITVLDHWGSEYYHWLLEALPRIIFLKASIKQDFTLILSERYKKKLY